MRTLAAIAWALGAASAQAQLPSGADFRVNTYTTGTQFFPAIAVEPDGDFVIVWESGGQDGSTTGIFGQRYDAMAARRGAEFRVNVGTTGYQSAPAVAVQPDGGFMVVWHDGGPPFGGPVVGLEGRMFDAAGTPVGGEFQVAGPATADQAVAVTAGGRYLVVWTAFISPTESDVRARAFSSNGSAVGPETTLTGAGGQGRPSVAGVGGEFVVAWTDSDPGDGDGFAVFARKVDATGIPRGSQVLVNSYTTGHQHSPSVTALRGGRFAVAWDSGTSSPFNAARTFSSSGAPIGEELFLAYGQPRATRLDADDAGTVVAVWKAGIGPSSIGQMFSAEPRKLGPYFVVNSYTSGYATDPDVGSDAFGNFVVTWWDAAGRDGDAGGIYARRFVKLQPQALAVDSASNGVVEPGEIVDVRPAWLNRTQASHTVTGAISLPAGPPAGIPVIVTPTAAYGTVSDGGTQPCVSCYTVQMPAPVPRPADHWDTMVTETLSPAGLGYHDWVMHVGDSFADVPRASGFYRFVETLLHHGVTAGCTPSAYCPSSPTSREQMAVFVLVAKEGAGYAPPACGAVPMFADVPSSSAFCPWVEELARRGVVSGCGGGNYCPSAAVTREQMAVFVLRTFDPALNPQVCAIPNVFADVPDSSPFCRWIQQLAIRGIVTGCGGGNFCPEAVVTREQMGVFIGATFGLSLYGP